VKANPMAALSLVACVAVIAIVAFPVAMLAAGVISTAIAGGGVAGLATLGAAALGLGATAAVEAPEVEADVSSIATAAQSVEEANASCAAAMQDAYPSMEGCGSNSPMFPQNPSEMDDIVGVKGEPFADKAGPIEQGGTPGRNRISWRPNDYLKITYENHSYDPTGGPINHTDYHYHIGNIDGYHSPGYLPGTSIPSYFWDWLNK
jgi:hypothetical protein